MTESTDCSRDDLIGRVRLIFDENPALHLTPSQAQRTFAATPSQTAHALEFLQDSGYLRRTRDGVFVRNVPATVSRTRSQASGYRAAFVIARWRQRLRRRAFTDSVTLLTPQPQ